MLVSIKSLAGILAVAVGFLTSPVSVAPTPCQGQLLAGNLVCAGVCDLAAECTLTAGPIPGGGGAIREFCGCPLDEPGFFEVKNCQMTSVRPGPGVPPILFECFTIFDPCPLVPVPIPHWPFVELVNQKCKEVVLGMGWICDCQL